MATHHEYFRDEEGKITGHISYTTCDATFMWRGKKVNMYFHNMLGPGFFPVEKGVEGEEVFPVSDEFWAQFDGWWEAKGKQIYGK